MLEESNNDRLESIYSPLNVILGAFPNNPSVEVGLISLRQIRDSVLGRVIHLSRPHAMTLLVASDFPNKHRDLQIVLENEEESPSIRYLAAVNLGKINTPASLEILLKNSEINHDKVLAGIMLALGRIGDKSALEIVTRIRDRYQTGFVASQANFAASLICYRLGLEGNELPFPDEQNFLEVSLSASRQFRIFKASENEAEFCLRCVNYKPFGIEFSEEHMYQIQMRHTPWMILFNRDFIDGNAIEKITKRKAIWGAIAKTNVESTLYSIAYLILTSPSDQRNGANILIYRAKGDLIFAGKMQLERSRAKFIVRTAARPGALPVLIEGEYADSRLKFNNCLTALNVQKRQKVALGIGPSMSKNDIIF